MNLPPQGEGHTTPKQPITYHILKDMQHES